MSDLDCSLLFSLLTELRLPEESIALALIYTHTFHRWQSSRQIDTIDAESLALAAISLAAKATEHPRRLREILVPAWKHLHPQRERLTYPSALYDTVRASVVTTELLLLRILKFELRIATPFDWVEDALRDCIGHTRPDKDHPEDYAAVVDTMFGIMTRATIIRALRNSRIAISYTARTVAFSCAIYAARILGMSPVKDYAIEEGDHFIIKVARENPGVDVKDCLLDIAAAHVLLTGD